MTIADDDAYDGLGSRVYINIQMEEHMGKLTDPSSLLGFREVLALVGINDEFSDECGWALEVR